MIWLVLLLGYWSMVAGWIVVCETRSWGRVYHYAERKAAEHLEHDVMDPMGRAYSDMATVIVLRGKLER